MGFGSSQIVRLERVDSTNDEARRRLGEDPPPQHGTVILAGRQTRGRGVGGNRWYSDDPDGLWMSLVLRRFNAEGPPSFLPAVALARMLRAEHGIDAHLKWPNDVLVGSRKVSGVLCETLRAADGGDAWILGVGINVNQQAFPEPIREIAVSMRQLVGGHELDREAVLRSFLAAMDAAHAFPAGLVAAWREHTRMIGARIRAVRRGAPVEGTVVDVNEHGHLVVETDEAGAQTWSSAGDVDIAPDFAL